MIVNVKWNFYSIWYQQVAYNLLSSIIQTFVNNRMYKMCSYYFNSDVILKKHLARDLNSQKAFKFSRKKISLNARCEITYYRIGIVDIEKWWLIEYDHANKGGGHKGDTCLPLQFEDGNILTYLIEFNDFIINGTFQELMYEW